MVAPRGGGTTLQGRLSGAITPEEEAALAEVGADRAAGVPAVPFDEVKRKYGLA